MNSFENTHGKAGHGEAASEAGDGEATSGAMELVVLALLLATSAQAMELVVELLLATSAVK